MERRAFIYSGLAAVGWWLLRMPPSRDPRAFRVPFPPQEPTPLTPEERWHSQLAVARSIPPKIGDYYTDHSLPNTIVVHDEVAGMGAPTGPRTSVFMKPQGKIVLYRTAASDSYSGPHTPLGSVAVFSPGDYDPRPGAIRDMTPKGFKPDQIKFSADDLTIEYAPLEDPLHLTWIVRSYNNGRVTGTVDLLPFVHVGMRSRYIQDENHESPYDAASTYISTAHNPLTNQGVRQDELCVHVTTLPGKALRVF